jgi:hypothetical protein
MPRLATLDVCGTDQQPPIIARGVLLDIAALHAVDVLPASYAIGKTFATRHGTSGWSFVPGMWCWFAPVRCHCGPTPPSPTTSLD